MPNESSLDRGLRIALGALILSFFFFGPRSTWGLLGLIPVLTGVIGFCPLYRLVGFSSCRASH